MKKRLGQKKITVESLAGGGICLLTGLLMLILTLTAFLFTTGMEIVNEGEGVDSTVIRIFESDESVVYYSDSFLANVIFLAVSIVACRLLLPAVSKLKFWHKAVILSVVTVAVGIMWVYSSQVKPTHDSACVTDAALAFAQNDFSELAGEYLKIYPYQLGYIWLCELILRAAIMVNGVPSTLLVLEAANVCFLALAYVGILLLTELFFEDKRVSHLTFLLLLFCAQPLLTCTFAYGIIPGVCFAVWAIVFQTLWFKRNKIGFGFLSALCIGFAAVVKSNNLIVLIALLIVAALRLRRRRQYIRDIAVMLALVFCGLTFSPAVRVMYERRSGIPREPGMPYIAWFAMGLSESPRAPGWHSWTASNETYAEMDFDGDALSEYSKQVIAEQISFFASHPQYARDFFYRKYVSQFNETTYQSIWNNKVRGEYGEKRAIAAWVCGDGEASVRRYMDVYSQLVFVGVLAALYLMLRRRDDAALILPLTVLGGMLFHLLAEGKSQYILPYFMLMLPLAAWGLTVCCDGTDFLWKRFYADRQKKAPEGPETEAAEPDAQAAQ